VLRNADSRRPRPFGRDSKAFLADLHYFVSFTSGHRLQPYLLKHLLPQFLTKSTVTTAILSQTKIGWEHLFRGIISSDWGFITSDSDRTPPHMRRETAHIHLTTIIHKLQNYTLHIWEGRNLLLHSNTAVSITIREAQVNLEISTLYAMRHTLSTRVQLYFQRPLETFLNAPYRHRQRWLIITRLATAQQQLPVTGQSQLTSYNFSIHPEFTTDRQQR
jgi:hypothetical protein